MKWISACMYTLAIATVFLCERKARRYKWLFVLVDRKYGGLDCQKFTILPSGKNNIIYKEKLRFVMHTVKEILHS
jgi:hypothetical protein